MCLDQKLSMWFTSRLEDNLKISSFNCINLRLPVSNKVTQGTPCTSLCLALYPGLRKMCVNPEDVRLENNRWILSLKSAVKGMLRCHAFAAVKPINPSRIQQFPTVSITGHKVLDSLESECRSKAHSARLHCKGTVLQQERQLIW